MDVFGEIIKPAIQLLMVPVKKQCGYLISCTQHVREMHKKMRELDVARQGEEDHVKRNTETRLEISSQVRGWLEEVEKTKAKVENFPNEVGSCCNLKARHKLGRQAFKIIEQIDIVKRQHSLILWNDYPIPLGRVDSIIASTSTQSTTDHDNNFQSREHIYIKALKALEPNHKTHMIALCGMGGVGKTTMMKRLKNVVKEKKMFNYIVEAVIGEKTDLASVQEAVSNYLGIELREKTQPARADKLREGFKAKSDGGKNKFLIILDDIWQSIDLEDIGLSTLPNQGVDFKVLLTSRDKDVCIRMGVEANSILNVKGLLEAEAQGFFRQFVENHDLELHKIGEDIVRKCCGLPIAIKTIAYTLKGRSKHVWQDALSRLEHHNIDKVLNEVFEMSYNNLQDEETKSIFLLCGLFPEDFDIPTEELVRYGWGLKLFKKVYTIREARNRLNTCIERLMHTNLLIESDDIGCVKIHDLVLAFILDMLLKGEHASFINHGDMVEWPADDMSGSYKKILLTCKGMPEFPRDAKFPNVSFLKIMHANKPLRFPEGIYGEMEKLQVISYVKINYPLLPSSLQCSTNLRVLYLHQCTLMVDCYSIGNLLNLEVLNISASGFELLPSTFGNLKKLRLLDLTDCDDLRIDNGVLINLVKLEELYVRAVPLNSLHMGWVHPKTISLTHDNINELAERVKYLSGLVFEFIGSSSQLKNMSFENLERFKISVGRRLDGDKIKSGHSFENTLKLVTNKGQLLESKMNELLEKTEVLCLSVHDMNDLEDVGVKSPHHPQSSSFNNLRVLVLSECAELRYLFTIGIAKASSNLEHLEISSCNNIEELIHIENSEEETITFPKLKFLSLSCLPKLSGLCHNVNIIQLPQLMELGLGGMRQFTSIYPNNNFPTSCLLKEEVVIPKLEKLYIGFMENLKEIWPCEFSLREEVMLREIEVRACGNLVNMFPCNPMPLLRHLEQLKIVDCSSIEVLFNINLDCVGEFGENEFSSNLRKVEVQRLWRLREIWRIQGGENNSLLPISGFQAVESIRIEACMRFRNVFTPTTANFDLGALTDLWIDEDVRKSGRDYDFVDLEDEQEDEDVRHSGRDYDFVDLEEEQEINNLVKEDTLEVIDSISNVVFSSYLIHSFHNLHNLNRWKYEGVEVFFQIEIPSSRQLVTTHNNQPSLRLVSMTKERHGWKCTMNKFFIVQKQLSESQFHNPTTIFMENCKNIKYLSSHVMAKLLSNLKKITIANCDSLEEVISNIDDEDEENTTSIHTRTTLFPHLDSLSLRSLQNLKCIGGGGSSNHGKNKRCINNTTTSIPFPDQIEVGGDYWSLCQYSREISISHCHALSSVIPCYAVGQMQKLQVLIIESCNMMKEVFETQGLNNNANSDEQTGGKPRIARLNDKVMLKLSNLKILVIKDCGLLEHILPISAIESLTQLKKLRIENCKATEVIVKEEHVGELTRASSKVMIFHRLKSIKLVGLPNLVGFFLGINEFRWPSLDYVEIKDCPKMIVFTSGWSTAPDLKCIHTGLGQYNLECGLNFHMRSTAHQTPTPCLDDTSSCLATSVETPWSFHNLIKLNWGRKYDVKKVIPSNKLLQLQNLEEIHVSDSSVVEVFEALEATNRGFDESHSVVKLSNLREVKLASLYHLRHIWKNNQWTVFEFPNLTKLSIHGCLALEHVFSSSMVDSLLQLQELHIRDCHKMEAVIVNDTNVVVEESDGRVNESLILPRLKTVKLDSLALLKGFCLGKEEFSLPILDTLRIKKCPAITVFTNGNSATPNLNGIETSFGSFYVGKDVNTFIKIKQEEFKFTDYK